MARSPKMPAFMAKRCEMHREDYSEYNESFPVMTHPIAEFSVYNPGVGTVYVCAAHLVIAVKEVSKGIDNKSEVYDVHVSIINQKI